MDTHPGVKANDKTEKVPVLTPTTEGHGEATGYKILPDELRYETTQK